MLIHTADYAKRANYIMCEMYVWILMWQCSWYVTCYTLPQSNLPVSLIYGWNDLRR